MSRAPLVSLALRKLMSEGKSEPPEFGKPEVIAILKEYYDSLETKPPIELHGATSGEAA